MKCINCGKESSHILCNDCTNPDVLEQFYTNVFLDLSDNSLKEQFPDVLALFDQEIAEYYYCRYFYANKDSKFEETALSFLSKHDLKERRSQEVLEELLYSYIPKEFVKPRKWYDIIAGEDSFFSEVYAVAAKYFAMVGEYELSDAMADKAIETGRKEKALYAYPWGTMEMRMIEQKDTTEKYRTKKPYWPRNEEARRQIAMFYDEKGIKHPPINK